VSIEQDLHEAAGNRGYTQLLTTVPVSTSGFVNPTAVVFWV
jgi:hypothetical protein